MRHPALARCAFAAALLAGAAARAQDRFEIQVYEPGINLPGQLGLELHANYTVSGVREPEYPGAIAPDRVARLTLEPAVGVTEWLEVGAYLQTAIAPGVGARYAGFKLRAKLVVPERLEWPVLLGVNIEVSGLPREFEEQGWANEIRPIIGVAPGRWLFVVNPIVGYALSGKDRFRPELEPAAKVAYDTRRGYALGIEYYGGLGPADAILPLAEQQHLLFAVLDLARGASTPPAAASAWELNVGIGAGLTGATGQHLVVKTIVGRAF